MRMREFINITEAFGAPLAQPSFGRRGVPDEPMARQIIQPPSQWRAEVEQARQYGSAEEFAEAMNPFHPRNTDPENIHRSYQDARNQLLKKWNFFQSRDWL